MVGLTEVQYVDGYRVRVKFNDGREGFVDLRDTIFSGSGPMILPLRDLGFFKRFRVDLDTIVWENGYDLAPEHPYELVHRPGGN